MSITVAATTPRFSKSARAGLTLPISRVVRVAKSSHGLESVSEPAGVALAAGLEAVLAEVITGACAARGDQSKQRKRITPYQIKHAIHANEELAELFGRGVLMNTYYVDTMETVETV